MIKRRKHSREFKLSAVARVEEGQESVAQIAADLGIERCMLHRWQRELTAMQQEAFPGQGQLSPEAAELAQLRRDLAQARMERDILKKVLNAFGSRRP